MTVSSVVANCGRGASAVAFRHAVLRPAQAEGFRRAPAGMWRSRCCLAGRSHAGSGRLVWALPDPGFDTTVSHSARIWNYWLGGKDNYAADREAGDKVALMLPSIVAQAR